MTAETFLSGSVLLHPGDCLSVLKTLEDSSVDAVVCDPPYGLEFMGKGWDGADGFRRSLNKADADRDNVFGRASQRAPEYRTSTLYQQFMQAVAEELYRVLKPGGHLLAFGGARTYHRMACAIEDAGFEIRDQVQWLYGSGFPKSLNVSKAIDRAAGNERPVIGTARGKGGDNLNRLAREGGKDAADAKGCGAFGAGAKQTDIDIPVTAAASAAAAEWDGFGTALKPACEPIVLARKPMIGTVAENVQQHGTGALNIDGCRVGDVERTYAPKGTSASAAMIRVPEHRAGQAGEEVTVQGRWPANVVHDGSDEVLEAFPDAPGQLRDIDPTAPSPKTTGIYGKMNREGEASKDRRYTENGGTNFAALPGQRRADSGSAARFFYTAKADADDRIGSRHPTVKPVDLMQWLVRLVTPPKGLVLDPFAGTGTTGEAAWREGMRCILIEREPEYQDDIRRRMKLCLAGPQERKRESIKAKNKDKPQEIGGLFAVENR